MSSAEAAQQEQEAELRLDDLQTRLNFKFKRRDLLREAMTHTSWINERGAEGRDNERLEYLGDAVLELVAGEYLFNRFPTYDEGQLTQMRSSLVSTVALARLGEQLHLGEVLRLGRGATKSGARRLTSLHANAFEALVGAVFLDQGYRRAGKIFLSRIGDLKDWTDPNFKGRLQALAQERFGQAPMYRTEPADSNPRSRQYVSSVSVEGQPKLGEGRGGTKQAAEQGAAKAAVDLLLAPVSKKRRRRPGRAATAGSAATSSGVLSPVSSTPAQEVTAVRSEIGPELGSAATTELSEGTGSVAAAPRKRRRRSRSSTDATRPDASPQAPGAEPSDQPPVAAGSSPQIGSPATLPPDQAVAGEVSDDPAKRKKTHRGHRGGRKRSGGTATTAP